MPAYTSFVPGKIILFGEHAVVYGESAIAVPITQVRARATILPKISKEPGKVEIEAPDIGMRTTLSDLPKDDPIASAIYGVMEYLEIKRIPSCHLKISSTIPVASGLGSGAAVSVAIIRTLAGFLGQPLSNEEVSKLAYEVEIIHHGTPSGIDNTVVTYEKPVFFTKDQAIEIFTIKNPFTIIIGDTGIPSPTKKTVGDVRASWASDRERIKQLFSAIGSISRNAKQIIETGLTDQLGPLMDENHLILQEIGVSSPKLDRMVKAAKNAGALGAKLSGAGRGGNMIALVHQGQTEEVRREIRQSGAVNTIITNVN